MQEKKELYKKQRVKMERKGSSFLDSIRMDVDNEDDWF